MKPYYLFILSVLIDVSSSIQAQTITLLQQNKSTSIRGLSVVNDKTAWISGSKGYIAITNDAGATWNWQQIKGYEKADFRDIEALSDKSAVIISSGTPALVLKTNDGGKTWKEKIRQTDTTYFLDAMDFADSRHGYILGDPISRKFLLMETQNGGDTWTPVKNAPDAMPSEAAFAASGTCLRVEQDGAITIVTGGKSSRMITLSPGSPIWKYYDLPIAHSKSSQGAFAIAMDKSKGIIVGGDYASDKKTDSVAAAYTINPFKITCITVNGPAGFQSGVEYIKDNIFLATGTSGSNITIDGGITWKQISDISFNVCRRAKHGKLVLLAGNGGKIAILNM